ncbi:MAG TPA: putative toxin-antitoxin system toxin component, PIN family [Stellaceae bacterium]|jgi:hypothetical protein|nr:putative toxin-antitoxin system toxin component, PIN family [Stellaceae bacterium]
MRVVLDTNILISALIRRDSVPGQVLRAWASGHFDLITHEIQLDEFRAVSRRPELRSALRSAEAGHVVNQIRLHADMVRRLPFVQRSRDPTDDFLLAMCEAGDVDYLVSGDKAGLLSLARHGRTSIVTARGFLGVISH